MPGSKQIAFIADIHGNVPAMEAVLADLDRRRPDEVLVGGDLVGRGPQGSKVVERIRERGWRGVRGNHEDYLLSFRRQEVPANWLHDDEWSASRWMAAELSDRDVDYIAALPLALHSRIAPAVCLVHGSPASNSEGLGSWSTGTQLTEQLGRIDGDVLVCAHTHRPMRRELSEGLVVNVGAVGLPFNRDHRAQYAMLQVDDAGNFEVEFCRVEYDLRRTVEVYESSGFLEQGGVTAQLLRMELEQAAPFLVPFTKWAESAGRPIDPSQLDAFLDFYDVDESMSVFMKKLESLGANPAR